MTVLEMKVVTNHHVRDVVQPWELSEAERAEFDYLDWAAIERGEATASFIRYRGVTYDLGDGFETTTRLAPDSPLRAWSGYQSDSFFSGIVVRYVDFDPETVVVGTYMC